MLWIAVAVLVAVAVLAALAVTVRRRRRSDEVDRFLRARALTTAWARQPSPARLVPVPSDREPE